MTNGQAALMTKQRRAATRADVVARRYAAPAMAMATTAATEPDPFARFAHGLYWTLEQLAQLAERD